MASADTNEEVPPPPPPPFYTTWWFILVVVIVGLLMVGLVGWTAYELRKPDTDEAIVIPSNQYNNILVK
jgi:hypothetical protein